MGLRRRRRCAEPSHYGMPYPDEAFPFMGGPDQYNGYFDQERMMPYGGPFEERVSPAFEGPAPARVSPAYQRPYPERVSPIFEGPGQEGMFPIIDRPGPERVSPVFEGPGQERLSPIIERPAPERGRGKGCGQEIPGPVACAVIPQKVRLPRDMCLAHAYVLWQEYWPPFLSQEEALEKGTIFPELLNLYEQRDF